MRGNVRAYQQPNDRSDRSASRPGGSSSQVFDIAVDPEALEERVCLVEEVLDNGLKDLNQRRMSMSESESSAKVASLKEGSGRESYEERKLLLYGKALEEAAELAVP